MYWINFLDIVLLLIFAEVFAAMDAIHINRKNWITEHTNRFRLRLIFIIALVVPYFMAADSNIVFLYKGLLLIPAFGVMFNFLFTTSLNRRIGMSPYHLGDTARWDRFWKERYDVVILDNIKFTIDMSKIYPIFVWVSCGLSLGMYFGIKFL